MKRVLRHILNSVAGTIVVLVLLAITAVLWLRWDAYKPRDAWFEERRGTLSDIVVAQSEETGNQRSAFVTLTADTDLSVSFRVLRHATDEPLPVLLVLGGHRTGSDAVELFGDVGRRAVVALDYPYDGPQRARGFEQVVRTLRPARKALLDTPPAVSLVVDWLVQQPWVDRDQLTIVGASLGVPFAAAAAARDDRLTATLLVHGAADNELWLEVQLARRVDQQFLHKPLTKLLFWLARGPAFDTPTHVAQIAPRPVLIIGARHDERTPAGQAELLFEAAGEPRLLRFTGGRHIQPGRSDVIAELLRIADEELPL